MMADYRNITDVLDAFPDEKSCVKHLEQLRWDGIIISPFNPISKVYKCKEQYRCSSTRKYFNVKTGTLFHNSKIPLRQWFTAIWIVTSEKPSITSVALGKELNITQKTAWFMMKRINAYYNIEKESTKQESKWPLVKKSKLIDNESPTENIEIEKLGMLEWLKMFK